jgi:hypothetical protein
VTVGGLADVAVAERAGERDVGVEAADGERSGAGGCECAEDGKCGKSGEFERLFHVDHLLMIEF